jgi:hypothetical protein
LRSVIDRLKSAAHINVVFERHGFDAGVARGVLDWLNTQSVNPIDSESIEAHMRELDRRRAGGWSLDKVAERTGDTLLEVRSFKLLDHFRFGRYDTGETVVSVDVLDAAGELEMPEPIPGMVLEVFSTYGREDREGVGLRRLTGRIVDVFPVRFAFGGHASFTARYAASLHKPQEALQQGSRPQDFLWPLTFTKEKAVIERMNDKVPVHYVERVADGLLIQVFDNLVTGQEATYREAAHALGLKSIWELKPPRPRRSKRS